MNFLLYQGGVSHKQDSLNVLFGYFRYHHRFLLAQKLYLPHLLQDHPCFSTSDSLETSSFTFFWNMLLPSFQFSGMHHKLNNNPCYCQNVLIPYPTRIFFSIPIKDAAMPAQRPPDIRFTTTTMGSM